MKLSDETIKQIQSADGSASHAEVARQLGVSADSVAKYRKELASTLSQKRDKESEKKLSLLEHYSSKDIQKMLNYIAQNTKKEIDEVL